MRDFHLYSFKRNNRICWLRCSIGVAVLFVLVCAKGCIPEREAMLVCCGRDNKRTLGHGEDWELCCDKRVQG